MKTSLLSSLTAVILLLASCQSNTSNQTQVQDVEENPAVDHHTSQISLDWAGTYEGVTPCADCPGIKTTVELKDDETFTYQAEYLEREQVLTDSGSFMWHDNGGIVHIKGTDTDLKFKVGENQLIQLDQAGQQITGELAEHYVLKKTR